MTSMVISKCVVLPSWKSINRGILAIAPESIVRISQCFLLVSLTFHIQQILLYTRTMLHPWPLSVAVTTHSYIMYLLSVVGLSDIPGEAMVKLYCPKCMDVYTPKSSRHHHTDGAYFGTGFPHMLFMVHPEYRPKRPANQFVPRCVFFSINTFYYMSYFYSYVLRDWGSKNKISLNVSRTGYWILFYSFLIPAKMCLAHFTNCQAPKVGIEYLVRFILFTFKS